jgi:GDSL-like Lipase/Acylhydrolase family
MHRRAPASDEPGSATPLRRAGLIASLPVIALVFAISLVWATAASSGSSATPAPPSASTARGNRVLLVGDSLLWQSMPPVASALQSGGWDPTIRAAPGTTIGAWTPKMSDFVAETRPDVVVVELGTNNCTAECPNLAGVIDRLMRGIPGSTPVYWLNVQSQPGYPAHPESVNDALAAALRRWSNLELVDLSARLRNHPEWHQADGLHLSAAGSAQLAGLIAESLGPKA